MFLKGLIIDGRSFVSDIVAADYRTADVFRRHNISYCCGGKWPLELVCANQGLEITEIIKELDAATKSVSVSNLIDFSKWDIDFLIDYILQVHHGYLKLSLPATSECLAEFVDEHRNKFSHLDSLKTNFERLIKQLDISMMKEEETLFPYIRQLSHAHRANESYAGLLVRTLRKPVEEDLHTGHKLIATLLKQIRELTDLYTPPKNVCTSHKVVIARLKELDNDISQHLFLEQTILFPQVLLIEKETLLK